MINSENDKYKQYEIKIDSIIEETNQYIHKMSNNSENEYNSLIYPCSNTASITLPLKNADCVPAV